MSKTDNGPALEVSRFSKFSLEYPILIALVCAAFWLGSFFTGLVSHVDSLEERQTKDEARWTEYMDKMNDLVIEVKYLRKDFYRVYKESNGEVTREKPRPTEYVESNGKVSNCGL